MTGEGTEDGERAISADEPLVRRTVVSAFRAAVLRLWGEAQLRALGEAMPPDCRADTVDTALVAREWLPERYVMSWYAAAWNGPCAKQNKPFLELLDRMMDEGFGRVRKLFLGLATPSMFIAKAPSLWRHDHTHGEIAVIDGGPGRFEVTLRDHPYTTTPLARMAIAEVYRYAFSLCRVHDVTSSHGLDPSGALLVRIQYR